MVETGSMFFKALIFLPFGFFPFYFCSASCESIMVSISDGKLEKIYCWVNINLRPGPLKIFWTLECVQDSLACINLPSRPMWYRFACGSPCINFVSKSDWYRPCCLEHFLKSKKSWAWSVLWLISTQQKTIFGDFCKLCLKGRLRAIIFRSANIAHLTASAKWHNNIRCSVSTDLKMVMVARNRPSLTLSTYE